MEIKLKSGKTIEFDSFTPKESNLIKVYLHHKGGDGEGIWACIDDKDMDDYKNDARDSEPNRVATLRNAALMFYPNNSWGACIPIRFDGNNRPECDIDWIEEDTDMIFIHEETQKEDGK